MQMRTALTRATPELRVVGTVLKMARPVAKSSSSNGISSRAKLSIGVMPRMDTRP